VSIVEGVGVRMSLRCIQFIVAERGVSAARSPALSLSWRSMECQMFEMLAYDKEYFRFPAYSSVGVVGEIVRTSYFNY
jgi:hypothetical protein